MKNIRFAKMHGTGNDFIVIEEKNCLHIVDYGKLAEAICNRKFGVGADGLLIVSKCNALPGVFADIKMTYYNSDGSLAEMCGNGVRCFAKYVYDKKIVNKSKFVVSTLAGLFKVEVEAGGHTGDGSLSFSQTENHPLALPRNQSQVTVNLGKPIFNPKEIPVLHDGEQFLKQKLIIDNETYVISTILLGVPHTVIFRDELEDKEVKKTGAIIETNEIFPKKTNVNFAKIISKTHVRVKTWERGAGYTLACGTGASSVFVLANFFNYLATDEEIVVETDGGKLQLSYNETEEVLLKGLAVFVFEGVACV